MDSEDHEHFKTIAAALVEPPRDLPKSSIKANSHSRLDRLWCLSQAKLIAGCYRRDEAQNPETFAAALAIVLGDYSAKVVEYATDPRTGVITRYPMGLPNVGQIKEFCDGVVTRQERLERYDGLRPVASQPVPALPGEETYAEFIERCAREKMPVRPIGRFE